MIDSNSSNLNEIAYPHLQKMTRKTKIMALSDTFINAVNQPTLMGDDK